MYRELADGIGQKFEVQRIALIKRASCRVVMKLQREIVSMTLPTISAEKIDAWQILLGHWQ